MPGFYHRLVVIIAVSTLAVLAFAQPAGKKILIAHRGASGYAPEHTFASYRLAIEQHADFVEQDLQITKDGVLVCMHDVTLERTTNAKEVFPDRFAFDVSEDAASGGQAAKHWFVADFTLAEIKRLDAGSWKDPKFKGERVPTWQETIDLVKGKAGLYPETKAPEVYGRRGFDMEKLLMDSLKKNHLDTPGADPKTPVLIQSFSDASLRKLRDVHKTKLPLVFLISGDPQNQWLTEAGLKKIKTFADGIGPSKGLIEREPKIVQWAHAAGLTVTPYTFRSAATGKYKTVTEEMSQFLHTYGVDALFTDNPDQFPRR